MALFFIGDADTVAGYRMAGVPGASAEGVEDARKALKLALTQPGIAVVLIGRSIARLLDEDIAEHRRLGRTPYLAIVGDLQSAPGEEVGLVAAIQSLVGIKTVTQ